MTSSLSQRHLNLRPGWNSSRYSASMTPLRYSPRGLIALMIRAFICSREAAKLAASQAPAIAGDSKYCTHTPSRLRQDLGQCQILGGIPDDVRLHPVGSETGSMLILFLSEGPFPCGHDLIQGGFINGLIG